MDCLSAHSIRHMVPKSEMTVGTAIPFFTRERIELYHGDCLSVLPMLSSESVDSVVTDPPYGQTNENYDGPHAISLHSSVWAECFRVCRADAALICFAGASTYHRIATAIESGGWKVRQMWAWIYRDGMIASAYPKEGFDRLAPAMDPIVYATKGKVLLSLNREGGAWEITKPRSKASPMSDRFRSPDTMSGGGHWPKSVVSDGSESFEYFLGSRTSSRKGCRTNHPNQKPIGLMEWIVEKLPSGVILDPFAGSATTGVAALKHGHHFIGIERDEVYSEIAKERLAGLSFLKGVV